MKYDMHNFVKYAQLNVLSVFLYIILFIGVMNTSIKVTAVALLGLLIYKGMMGFHYLWFASINTRRTFK